LSEELIRSLSKSQKRIARLEQVTAEHRHFRDPQWDEWCRRCNRYGRAQYTDHFRSGVIPTGYAWINDGTFNGAPGGAGGELDYSHQGTYMAIVCDASPHFLATAITVYEWKHFMGRFCTARSTICGIRADDGTTNNYAQWFIEGNTDGSYTPTFSFRAGGGAVTSNTAMAVSDTEFISLMLYHYADDPAFVGYTVNEAGSWSYPNGADTGVIAWTPTRIGLMYSAAGYPCFTDLFYSTYE
jgi:hypothetical protein